MFIFLPLLPELGRASGSLQREGGSQVQLVFNTWDSHPFYAPSVHSYLTASVGAMHES